MSKEKQYNPRYVIWAKLHGNTPEQQMALDKKRWPGGCMCGYNLWIDAKARDFAKIKNEPREIVVLSNQKEFTELLQKCLDYEPCEICKKAVAETMEVMA